MDPGNIVDSVSRGYFIAATMRLLFNKNKNPLNMETLQQAGGQNRHRGLYLQRLRAPRAKSGAVA